MQSGSLNFDGHVSRIDTDADVKGRVSLTTGGLTDFVATLLRAGGQEPPAFDAAVNGQFSFDGDIERTAEKLALTNFKMSMGNETVSGDIDPDRRYQSLAGEPPVAAQARRREVGRTAFQSRDLQAQARRGPACRRQARRRQTSRADLARPFATKPQAAAPAAAAAAKPAPAAAAPAAPSLSPFPPALTVLVSVDAKEVLYRKGTVRDVALAVEIRKGVIAVPRLNAILPGDMVLQANATAAAPAGSCSQACRCAGDQPGPVGRRVQPGRPAPA